MAAVSLPVVSTALGAEGLAAQPGVEIEFAETPLEFCSQVTQLRDNCSRWRKLSIAGRKLVEARTTGMPLARS